MQEISKIPSVSETDSRRQLFDQVATIFAGEGSTVDATLKSLMQPLLDGTMSYEEHRVMLEARLKELGG